jgi:hypothetical protein
MRIRTVKPEFFLHDGLFEAEKEAGLPLRVAFIGLWCAADREGRFRWEPRRLGAAIMPYDGVDFSRVLDALATHGFLVRYACNDVGYGYIPSFGRHQFVNPREKPSQLPAPPENPPTPPGKGTGREQEGKGRGVEHASLTREPRVLDASTGIDPGAEAPPTQKGGKFVRPTLAELRLAFAKAAMPEAEAEKFLNYYESNGWKVGRNAMKSWQHAIGNWKSHWEENRNGQGTNRSRRNETEAPGERFISGADEVRRRIVDTDAASRAAMVGPIPL